MLRFAPVLVVLALTTAPLAGAQPQDRQFLEELAALNISFPPEVDVVTAGYDTCHDLRGGTSVLDEMDAVEHRYLLTSGQGTLFVSAATTNLCPDFAG